MVKRNDQQRVSLPDSTALRDIRDYTARGQDRHSGPDSQESPREGFNDLTDLEEIKRAYVLWLKGVPLRTLARQLGVRNHNLLCTRFRKVFGVQATSLEVQSLWRSLLEDYEEDPEVETWVVDQVLNKKTPEVREAPGKYRSRHSLQQLANYQVIRKPELMDYLIYTEDPMDSLDLPAWDWLRLPLFLPWSEFVCDLLVHLEVVQQELSRADHPEKV